MKRTVVALIASLCAFPSVAFSGWFDKKEQVALVPKLSDAQQINDDVYLKATASTANMAGMCNDNFLYALSRNVIGANGKTLVVLTYDAQSLLVVEYDQKNRGCKRDTSLERDLTSYILVSKLNKQHKLNLVYAADEEVKTLENALHFATPFVAAASPAGALVGLPVTQEVSSSFDGALARAVSPHDSQTIGFQLPDNNGRTKLTLYANIGSQPFRLVDLDFTVRRSLLDGKRYKDIMSVSLDGTAEIEKVILEHRSKDGIAFKAGDYDVIKNECRFLRGAYQSRLNTLDMQRLQEAYLLEYHRDMMTAKALQQCFDYEVANPHQELTFQLLADLITPTSEELDTFFLKLLTTGEYEKVLSPNAKINDRDTNLRVASVSDYIGLKGASAAACHTSIGYNQVGFIQSIGNQSYYLTVSVDRLYTKEEAGQGKLPVINNISISTSPDDDYKSIPGVTRCINDWSQSRKVASGW